jgi:hypothetical protein
LKTKKKEIIGHAFRQEQIQSNGERKSMNRRQFLRISGIVIGATTAGATGLLVANEVNRDQIADIKEILNRKLIQRYGASIGNSLSQKIDLEYQNSLSQLPNIGAVEDNKWVVYMPPTALALAAYRILVPGKLIMEPFGKLFFETIQEQMNNITSSIMKIVGTDQGMKEKTKLLAERSQRRQYKEDWVINFVEGNGPDFTYGIDVTECAIQKYLAREGAPELTRYLCLTDYITSEAIGRGLVRNKTLAEGCDHCDFRYKQGRDSYLYPLRNGWPPLFFGENK